MQFIPDNLSIDFVGKRKFFITLSLVLNVTILVGIAIFGFNWGIDFAGGTEMEVKFASTVSPTEVRKTMESAGFGDAMVQDIGSKGENSFLIRIGRVALMTQDDAARVKGSLDQRFPGRISEFRFDPSIGDKLEVRFQQGGGLATKQEVQAAIESAGVHVMEVRDVNGVTGYDVITRGITDKVKTALEDAKDRPGMAQAEVRRAEYVGPQVGRELRNQGVLSVLIAALFILGYVALRFETRFAPGAVIALFHDIIIVFGYYLVSRREFNLTSVAVVLTIVGYSINDTIVVYDRIRENLAKHAGMNLLALINLSINETLSRTILTSLTTVLSVTGLLFFGVGQIWDFAAAMIIGIITGTYSSIYIASPTTIWLEEMFDKRKAAASGAKPAAST